MFVVSSAYPPDAVGGADFFSGAAQRQVIDVDNAGREQRRLETILVDDKDWHSDDYVEGRVCVSETSVRSMAALLGFPDPLEVSRVARENMRLRAELDQVSAENVAMKQAIESLNRSVRTLYVAADGTVHGSALAAQIHDSTPPPVAAEVSVSLPELPESLR